MPTSTYIRRKLTPSRRKVAKEKTFWYIAKTLKNVTYYLSDFDKENSTALWSRRRENGITFKTNQGANMYIATKLNGRSDVYLVCTKEK